MTSYLSAALLKAGKDDDDDNKLAEVTAERARAKKETKQKDH